MGLHNHLVLGARTAITDQQLFIELLTRSQPGKRDGNVSVRILLVPHGHTHQMHHGTGQIHNTHRLAHIQHENFTALGHGTRLDHQLGGLRNGHEIANHIRVGHRHRPALLNLVTE